MHWRIAQLATLVAAGFLTGQESIHAQRRVSVPADAPCPPYDDYQPTGPQISIAEVTFSGSLQMPLSEQVQISDSTKRRTYGTSVDDVTDEGLERVKAGWQDRGYFKVEVSGEANALTGSPTAQRVALKIHVIEGAQYNLGGITFKNNRAIRQFQVLRDLFPIQDGDIFSREKIVTGLENLRRAYGSIGYINFTSVPNTIFDEENKLISVGIDLDEGKQFRVSSLDVLGLDDSVRAELLKDSPVKPGQIYREDVFNTFLEKHISLLNFHPDEPGHVDRRLNEQAGTIAITINAAPCDIQ